MEPVRGPLVTLRPFRLDELATLKGLVERSEPYFMAHVPRREGRLENRVKKSGRFVEGRLDLAIEANGRLVGDIEARRPRDGLPPGVFEIGITLFEEANRGKGLGSQALSLFTELLFSRFKAERVQASTSLDNRPMRAVLEKLGYTFEGTMRGFMPAPEGREDYGLYGVTRQEWEARTSD